MAEYEDDNRQIREELNKLKKEADEGSNTLELRKKERQQYKDDLVRVMKEKEIIYTDTIYRLDFSSQ